MIYSLNEPTDPMVLDGHAATFDKFTVSNSCGRIFSPIPTEFSPYFEGMRSMANGVIERARNEKAIRGMPNVELAIFVWTYSIAGLFFLWGLKLREIDPTQSLYPPTALRLMMAVQMAEVIVKSCTDRDYFSITGEQVRTITMTAVAALMANLHFVGWSRAEESWEL